MPAAFATSSASASSPAEANVAAARLALQQAELYLIYEEQKKAAARLALEQKQKQAEAEAEALALQQAEALALQQAEALALQQAEAELARMVNEKQQRLQMLPPRPPPIYPVLPPLPPPLPYAPPARVVPPRQDPPPPQRPKLRVCLAPGAAVPVRKAGPPPKARPRSRGPPMAQPSMPKSRPSKAPLLQAAPKAAARDDWIDWNEDGLENEDDEPEDEAQFWASLEERNEVEAILESCFEDGGSEAKAVPWRPTSKAASKMAADKQEARGPRPPDGPPPAKLLKAAISTKLKKPQTFSRPLPACKNPSCDRLASRKRVVIEVAAGYCCGCCKQWHEDPELGARLNWVMLHGVHCEDGAVTRRGKPVEAWV